MKSGNLVRLRSKMFDLWHDYASTVFIVTSIQDEFIMEDGDVIGTEPLAWVISEHGLDSFRVNELRVVE